MRLRVQKVMGDLEQSFVIVIEEKGMAKAIAAWPPHKLSFREDDC